MTDQNDAKAIDAAKRFIIFSGRLVDSGMDEQDLVHGLLAATISITSGSLDQSRRKEFAKWLRSWAKAVEQGELDPEAFNA